MWTHLLPSFWREPVATGWDRWHLCHLPLWLVLFSTTQPESEDATAKLCIHIYMSPRFYPRKKRNTPITPRQQISLKTLSKVRSTRNIPETNRNFLGRKLHWVGGWVFWDMLCKSFGCLDTSLFVCLLVFLEHQLKTLPVFHGLFGGPSCGDIRELLLWK